MKKTIVHILCHSLIRDKNLDYYMFGGFGPRQIRGLRPYINNYNYEVWYAVVGLKKRRVIRKDGIVYRIFPAWTLNKTLESYLPIVSSPELFVELSRRDPRNILIHFQGERGTLLHYLLFKYPQYSVVIQYHGYGQPPKLDWIESLFITPFEKINYPKVKHFFVPIKPRIKYLRKKIHIPISKISTENIGIDFNLFKPASKHLSRKKLDIPSSSFVLLYVGHLMKSKGADKIFAAYDALKQRYPHLYLLVVGALENDPLYAGLKDKADRIVHFVSNSQMPTYLNASNVLCFYGNSKNIKFAGPGIAPTEAMACNLNVISTNNIHFDNSIMRKLGLIPTSYSDLLMHLESLIKKPNFSFKTRSLVAPHVSFKSISLSINKVYESCLTYKNNNL